MRRGARPQHIGVGMLTAAANALDVQMALDRFQREGFVRLGPMLTDEAALALSRRAGRLMQERVDGMFYQHDAPSGRYEDLVFNAGWVGPSTRYRKLERLELDPLFFAFIENPLFERLTRSALGDEVRLYRSVLWNKAPERGMAVPWHQDDGRFWGLTSPPWFQVWTALDDASAESGCLEVVPGSHKAGLATREGGTLTPDLLERAESEAVSLEARRGECILVHNHTWHRTGPNRTAAPRRAVSLSFLGPDARCARRRRAPRVFRRLFQR